MNIETFIEENISDLEREFLDCHYDDFIDYCYCQYTARKVLNSKHKVLLTVQADLPLSSK